VVQGLFPESPGPVATVEKKDPAPAAATPAPVPATTPEVSTPVEEPTRHASLPTVAAAVLAPLGVGTLLTLMATPLAMGGTYFLGALDAIALGPNGFRNTPWLAIALVAAPAFLVAVALGAALITVATTGAFALGAWAARRISNASGPIDGAIRAVALGTGLGAAALLALAAGTAAMLLGITFAAGARIMGTLGWLGGPAVTWGGPTLAVLGLGTMAAISLGAITAGGVLLYRNVSSSPPEEEPAAP
jgi:hypothetical protein